MLLLLDVFPTFQHLVLATNGFTREEEDNEEIQVHMVGNCKV